MSTRRLFVASPAVLLSRPFPSPLRVVLGDLRAKRPLSRASVALRGVRKADYTIDGCAVFEAIDSRGDRVRAVKQPPCVDEEIVREWLWGYLERVDPRLRLA